MLRILLKTQKQLYHHQRVLREIFTHQYLTSENKVSAKPSCNIWSQFMRNASLNLKDYHKLMQISLWFFASRILTLALKALKFGTTLGRPSSISTPCLRLKKRLWLNCQSLRDSTPSATSCLSTQSGSATTLQSRTTRKARTSASSTTSRRTCAPPSLKPPHTRSSSPPRTFHDLRPAPMPTNYPRSPRSTACRWTCYRESQTKRSEKARRVRKTWRHWGSNRTTRRLKSLWCSVTESCLCSSFLL